MTQDPISGYVRTKVVCVFRHANRIPVGHELGPTETKQYYCPPGGRIEFGEKSEDALRREMREELGAEIEEPRLLGVLENLFIHGSRQAHEIVFVYDAEFKDKSLYERDHLTGRESNGAAFDAIWLDIGAMGPTTPPLYPEGLVEFLNRAARPRTPATEGSRLAEYSRAVRKSSLKRLEDVPPGFENWRVRPDAMSLADMAHHLLEADRWLFAKLKDTTLKSMVGRAGEAGQVSSPEYWRLLDELRGGAEERAALLAGLSDLELASTIPDERFGGEVTVWWVIIRGNLDHEAHHRGQLAAFLQVLRGEGRPAGG
jgi:8-oxo-dGTP pyrophosphatase MutT (NUDIX family)/uncharacterized damage-inducible protein DinB